MSVDCSLALGELPADCSASAVGEASASFSSTDSMCAPPRTVMSSAGRAKGIEASGDSLHHEDSISVHVV